MVYLHPVTSRLYRSPQPREDDWAMLASYGFRAVVNLRDEDDTETALVEAAGMRAIHIPVVDWSVPTWDQVREFIRVVDEPAHHDVLVHCFGGVGRTGIMVSCYRIAKGMPADEALRRNDSEIRFSGMALTAEQERFVRAFRV